MKPPPLTYGDVLRYPIADDPDTRWLFMFLHRNSDSYKSNSVVVVKVATEDDQWEIGMIIDVGRNELERAE